ncbi:hypothetical protein D2T29_16020 [Sinirhodobacter populi]|uniref:Uncharacterized protein n=1 Tax=Paenirhodobacter populi TaxID=2306993 RepID=A0A443K7K1_9RHOB|nr:hypothetical protein [Sinirhodobacter populi]RWR28734.1 hypothetical protein D2T29_16020 [Sinirhodobacter populi]
MTHVSSGPALAFDSSSADFLHAAGDVGEVIAILAGGARPDPKKIARLSVSLRGVQTYLIDGGRERSRFESVDDALADQLVRAAEIRRAGLPVLSTDGLSIEERRVFQEAIIKAGMDAFRKGVERV